MPSSFVAFLHFFTGKLRVEGLPPSLSRHNCYSTVLSQWQVFKMSCARLFTHAAEREPCICVLRHICTRLREQERTCHCLLCECACCPRYNHCLSGSSLVCLRRLLRAFLPARTLGKNLSVSEPETEILLGGCLFFMFCRSRVFVCVCLKTAASCYLSFVL